MCTVLITHALAIGNCLRGEVTIKQFIPNVIPSVTLSFLKYSEDSSVAAVTSMSVKTFPKEEEGSLSLGHIFTPDLGRPCAVYAMLAGLDQESSGAERQGRRLCTAVPRGHGEAGCRLTWGLLMDVSGNPAGTEEPTLTLPTLSKLKFCARCTFHCPFLFTKLENCDKARGTESSEHPPHLLVHLSAHAMVDSAANPPAGARSATRADGYARTLESFVLTKVQRHSVCPRTLLG